MESPTPQECTEHGQKLKGKDLQTFIVDKQTHYREQRAAEKKKSEERNGVSLKERRV